MTARSTRSANQARIEAERLRRERERTAKLMQKAERKRGLERKTERRPEWQKLSARARKALRDAERSLDPKVVARLNIKARKLLEEADRLSKAPPKGLVERALRMGSFRSDTSKPMPSLRLVAWYQDNGRWCQQADGTFFGDAHFTVPLSPIDTVSGEAIPRYDYDAFSQWFIDLVDPLDWFDKEPVWWNIGYAIGGLQSEGDRRRYDRIRGQSGTLSYWRKPSFLGGEQGSFLKMINTWLRLVARNIYEADLRITSVSLFAHYGPTAPIRPDEFNCDEEMPKKTVYLIADNIKKKFLQTEGQSAFAVYDRRGRGICRTRPTPATRPSGTARRPPTGSPRRLRLGAQPRTSTRSGRRVAATTRASSSSRCPSGAPRRRRSCSSRGRRPSTPRRS